MTSSQVAEGDDAISSGRTRSLYAIVITCFLIAMFDGLDINAITFTAPVLARAWGITPAQMAPVFLATSAGAVVGYIACGALVVRWGQRTVAVASVLLFSLGTLATVTAIDIITMSLLRFVTSVGLGGALPVAVAMAAGVMPARHRGTAAILVATGLSAGGVVGGVLGAPLMAHFGWTAIFIVGGILPLPLLPAILHLFGTAQPADAATKGEGGKLVGELFRQGLAARTTLLWLFSFLVFIDAYALLYWIPSLLSGMGMPSELAPASTAVFSMGGLVGNIALTLLISRLGAPRTLMVASAVGLVSMAVFGLLHAPLDLMMPLVFGIGAGSIPCCVGQSALAVAFYPDRLRAAGIGWAAAVGRIGSIFGPAAGGAALSLQLAPQQIILAATLPVFCAFLVLVVLAGRKHQGA
ncbi:major facilitator superfamily MFS-1 (plasmid) [Azospirillum sp. B510]|uniref:MFS transporter n=1 Tax=Azospirillum sp. (strain B510) TaxID=137722 RepID=UPI0001C4B9A9|nr:MFS transporter [Azospirillum sp. B510]BAI74216.1 major facilitator superfamily MFS-1 [Azospirillum sp. B510]